MKRSYLLLIGLFIALTGFAQNKPLPAKTFVTLRDSTTSMDVVMMQGKGGSLSLEGRNVRLFNGFFENKTSDKFKAPQAGNIMWLINGREFISGNYFLGDSTGYIIFTRDGKEYVNAITPSGTSFFKSQVKN
ncbi:MAG: hypothetical protein U0T75_17135 [Chitinophagales bacterium]